MKKCLTVLLVILLVLGASLTLVSCDGFNIDFGKILTNYVNYENLYLRVEYPDAKREFSKYGDMIYITDIRDDKIVDSQFMVKSGEEYYNIIALQGKFYKMALLKDHYDETVKYMSDTQAILSKVSKNQSDYALKGDTLTGKDSNGHPIAITFGSDHLRYKAENIQYVFKKAKQYAEPPAGSDIILVYYLARLKNASAMSIRAGGEVCTFSENVIEHRGVVDKKNIHEYFVKDGEKYVKITQKEKVIVVDPTTPPSQENAPAPAPTARYDYEQRQSSQTEYDAMMETVTKAKDALELFPTDITQYIVSGNKYQCIIKGEEFNLTLYGDMLAVQNGDMIITFCMTAKVIVPIAEEIVA